MTHNRQIFAPRRADPWVFNIESYGAVGDAVIVHDGAVTGGVATLTCATSAPFTSGLAGKPVLIKGAGATGVTSFTTTFSAYNSPTSMALTDAPPTSITGAIAVFGTNSYAAIQAATDAAEAYLAAGHTLARVYIPPKPYIIDGPLRTNKSGNGQIVFGVYPTDQVKKILEFTGETDGAAAVRHWQQQVPQFAGSCLISFGVYASTAAQITSVAAAGNPGVISGPTEGAAGYGKAALYSNIMPVLKNLAILTAHSAYGLTYGAYTFWGCANSYVENVGYSTMGTVASPSTDYTSPGVFGTGLSVGALHPANGNNDHNVIRNLSCGGGYTYGMFLTEHGIVDRFMALYCWAGLCPVGSYNGSVGATHAMKVLQASVEACGREIYFIGPGSEGVTIFDCDQLQTESGTPTFDGNSLAALASAVGTVKLTGLFTPGGVTVGAPTGLRIINGQVARPVARKTGNYAVTVTDETVLVDATAGPITVTLIDADYTPNQYTVIKTDASGNAVTVAAASGQLINGSASQSLASQYTSLTAYSAYNGTAYGWYRK